MKFKIALFSLFLSALVIKGQNICDSGFLKDTLSLPEQNKVLEGESLETTLKNLSVVKIFMSDDDKLYLKFVVTQNFYFNKVDNLEIKSGSKSYWVKPTKQYKITKTLGLFVVEVAKNYIVTLKDDGITSIVFGGAETDFTKQDASQIKKISRCFYETIYRKNNYQKL